MVGVFATDLLNPERDAIALLRGHRVFTMQMQNSEQVIGKIKKEYEFLSSYRQ